MRHSLSCWAVLTALMLLPTQLSAQINDPSAMEFNARDYEYCLVCHGSFGQGNIAVKAPVLAGMEAWSIRNQLQAFREGWRGSHSLDLVGMEMAPSARALQPSELPTVIEYITALPPQTAHATDAASEAEIDLGKTLYEPCIACHGAAADGDQEYQAPALAYQDGAYLLRQLQHFRDGVRGSHPKDKRGARMAAAASGLDDAAIARIISYIKSQAP
ncbi:c-type cytochrome [Congregibacter variabilis]|uniref:C-type cytochrome n=1 Tax=Congregibacter variabilis TaxID=3081200 RepID=A0ABZ0I213_9GAMM|nr:c-type cytochrome [Congregibacter sp. IMCC43200]